MGAKYIFAIESKNANNGLTGIANGAEVTARYQNDTGRRLVVGIMNGGAELAAASGGSVVGTRLPREGAAVGVNALVCASSVDVKIFNGTRGVAPGFVRLPDVCGFGGSDGIEVIRETIEPRGYIDVTFRNRTGQTVNAWLTCTAEQE